jgi:hypothetical protein
MVLDFPPEIYISGNSHQLEAFRGNIEEGGLFGGGFQF